MHKDLGSSPAPHKLATVMHVCEVSIEKVEAGRAEIQGHPQILGEFKARLHEIYYKCFLIGYDIIVLFSTRKRKSLVLSYSHTQAPYHSIYTGLTLSK